MVTPLSLIHIFVAPDTAFYINESRIEAGEGAKPSLLFDDVVSSEDGAGNYGELLKNAALKVLNTEFSRPQYEACLLYTSGGKRSGWWRLSAGRHTDAER